MSMRKKLLGVTLTLALSGAGGGALAVTEIQWWHAMGGELGEKLSKIAEDFNATQDDYRIVPVYKGKYTNHKKVTQPNGLIS